MTNQIAESVIALQSIDEKYFRIRTESELIFVRAFSLMPLLNQSIAVVHYDASRYEVIDNVISYNLISNPYRTKHGNHSKTS